MVSRCDTSLTYLDVQHRICKTEDYIRRCLHYISDTWIRPLYWGIASSFRITMAVVLEHQSSRILRSDASISETSPPYSPALNHYAGSPLPPSIKKGQRGMLDESQIQFSRLILAA